MRTILIVSALSLSALPVYAAGEESTGKETEESWTLELSEKCNTVKLKLPLPALNMSCDLDTKSGNPSKWHNPFETCELEFDMIGLPSLQDIATGMAGQVCKEVKTIKSQTIDVLIDEINAEIPDNLGEEISGQLNLNEELNEKIEDWSSSGEAQPSIADETCYTTDTSGGTITVPCSIANNTSANGDQCYFKSNNYNTPFTETQCSRYNMQQEQCIVEWKIDSLSGQQVPVLGSCTSTLRATQSEACKENGIIGYCRDVTTTTAITQNIRQCGGSGGNTVACSDLPKSCYGHLNGTFQAADCAVFHDQYFHNPQGSIHEFQW